MTQNKFFDQHYEKRGETVSIPDWKVTDYQMVSGKKILSIGSGPAGDLWHLADKNDVTALDSSLAAMKIAGEHKVKGKIHDVQQPLPFKNKTFDIIVLKDILEHLIEPEKLILESKRILKDDGYIVISIPNHFSFWFRLRYLLGKGIIWKSIGGFDHTLYFEEWNYMHIRFFTWKGFNRFINCYGLRFSKGYWDFDTLAHYNDPDMYYSYMVKKADKGDLIALRFIKLHMIYKLFSLIFPKKIRQAIVSLNPGLLCSGFYVHVRKK